MLMATRLPARRCSVSDDEDPTIVCSYSQHSTDAGLQLFYFGLKHLLQAITVVRATVEVDNLALLIQLVRTTVLLGS